jgi:plasmid stabilization system protein ParE
MTYRVIITPEAETDLRAAYRYIRAHAPHAARDWIRRARQSAKSLAHRPERCPLAPESVSFDQPIRELLFGTGNRGTYRFLFVVIDRSVYIVHVRHGSMLPLSPLDE